MSLRNARCNDKDNRSVFYSVVMSFFIIKYHRLGSGGRDREGKLKSVFVTREVFALNGHKENQTSYMIFIHSRVMAVFQMKLCVMRRSGKLRAVFLALEQLV